MERLISIEKLENVNIKINIVRMPKTLNHYKIVFRECGGSKLFFDNVVSETFVNSKSYEAHNKNGVGVVHIHLSKDDDNARYDVTLTDSEWVRKHIKDITRQLLHQEEQILINIALKRQVKAITQAVRSNSYTSLIQQMIRDNASNLSRKDLEEIRTTLDEVEQRLGILKP